MPKIDAMNLSQIWGFRKVGLAMVLFPAAIVFYGGFRAIWKRTMQSDGVFADVLERRDLLRDRLLPQRPWSWRIVLISTELAKEVGRSGGMISAIKSLFSILKREGLAGLRNHFSGQIVKPSTSQTIKPFALTDYLPSNKLLKEPPVGLGLAVIVPVYRGYEQTRSCINSVLQHLGDGRLDVMVIAVDDCSPEPELSAWLQSLAATNQIHLLQNKHNKGFVGSVNAGIRAAGERDVVLLNSDTQVASHWLSKLAGHAYSEANIGTVTPFSNNATICSWPTINGGPLPVGETVDSIDKAFVAANCGRQVELPTAVGFCMYIRRRCLDEVGYFDEATFGRGYGEENDFCMKATARGWRHILACDTFVFHEGETSFGKDSPERKRAWELMTDKYPGYAASVARHIEADAIKPSRFAATAAIFRKSEIPVILIVDHSLGGGVERHVSGLLALVGTNAHFLQLRPNPHGFSLSVPSLPGHPEAVFLKHEIDELVQLLRSFGLCRIHIHHWIGFDDHLRALVDKLKLPFDLTIHDYYAICPRINLLRLRESMYCNEPANHVCNECIAKQPVNGARDITEWRVRQAWLLQEAERVICPSHDVASRIARHEPHARVIVAPHEPVASGEWRVNCRKLGPCEPMRIGILGVVARHKGRNLLASLIEEADPGKYRFTIIGYCDPQLPMNVRRKVEETGEYKEADLPALIGEAKLHALWFPVIVPETYSYTLSAAIDAELPIIAPTIGAFPERLEGRPLTWLVEPAQDVSEMLSSLARLREDLLQSRNSLTGPRLRCEEPFYPDVYLKPFRNTKTAESTKSRTLRRKGVTSVLVLPDRYNGGGITPCGYIRLVLPFDHAAEIHKDVLVQVVDLESALSRDADILVCQRHVTRDLPSAEKLISHCRSNDIKIVYDLDDDLLHIPPTHPEAAYLQDRAALVLRFLLEADAVWVATPALKARLSTIRADAVVICNRHDERIWCAQGPAKRPARQPISILYMGTHTHDAELEFLTPIAEKLVARHGEEVHFEVVGVTSGRLPKYFRRIYPADTASAETYPQFVKWFMRQSWDIALCPLIKNDFNACKSSIKLLDYAAIKVPVIASKHEDYLRAFGPDHGIELIDNNPTAWVDAISGLVRDPALRLRRAALASEHYAENHILAGRSEIYRAALMRALDNNNSGHGEVTVLQLTAEPSDQKVPVSRKLLSSAFLHGEGLEVGALHNPLPVGSEARVKYVDRFDKAGLYEHYPELLRFALVDVDIVDDGEKLPTVNENSQDFLIANHFLEHAEDPFSTLKNLLRVLKPGGLLFMALPDKRYTFDCNRETTQLEHLIEDYQMGPEKSRDRHYHEWVTLVEPHFGRFGPGTPLCEIEKRINELKSSKYSIHFHCWTSREVVQFLDYARLELKLPFHVVFFAEYRNEKENIFMLRKL
jgi:GT2 family glycosyltransferase/predicted SAM-dependent methyltransferase